MDCDELLKRMTITRRALRVRRAQHRPDGFDLGFSEGEIAGADFDHPRVPAHPLERGSALPRRFDATGGTP